MDGGKRNIHIAMLYCFPSPNNKDYTVYLNKLKEESVSSLLGRRAMKESLKFNSGVNMSTITGVCLRVK